MPARHALAALVLTSAALVSACSSTTLTDGVSLAKAGQTAAGQMEQNASLTAATYTSLKKAVIFDNGFSGDINSPESQSFLDQEAQIQSKLSAYGSMLEKLAGAYAALGNLAAYDAAGNFNTASNSLCGSATNLIKEVSPTTQVPANLCTGISRGAGLIIGAVQAQQVRDASASIEAILETVIPILADPHTRNLIVMNSRLVERQIVGTSKELFATGIYSCGPLLDDLGAPLNLKTISGADALVAKKPNIRRGCLTYITAIAKDTTDSVGKAYDKSVEGLQALIPLHKSLEAGAPLNLDTINTIVTTLQGLATKLQPQKGK